MMKRQRLRAIAKFAAGLIGVAALYHLAPRRNGKVVSTPFGLDVYGPVGVLAFTGAVSLNNSAVTIAGSNNLTLAGPVTVADATPATGSEFTNTLTVTSTGVTTISGALAGDGNLLLAGSGSGYQNLTGAATVVLAGNTPAAPTWPRTASTTC